MHRVAPVLARALPEVELAEVAQPRREAELALQVARPRRGVELAEARGGRGVAGASRCVG